jgi:hypothetical protein
VKLEVDRLSTVPDAPPEAGPERALDPPLPAAPGGPGGPAVVAVAEGEVAVVADEVVQAAESPITALISAAPTIHLLLDGNRHAVAHRACLAMVAEAEESDDDGEWADGAAPAPELPATGGPNGALDTGQAGRLSGVFVGSSAFMMALL